jgi:hypothetical protein
MNRVPRRKRGAPWQSPWLHMIHNIQPDLDVLKDDRPSTGRTRTVSSQRARSSPSNSKKPKQLLKMLLAEAPV